jgi:DNA-binding transcriptional regulator YiaG
MKICTKCKIEKELTQFQTYWHSTQQKTRTRGECTECSYKQRNERRRLKRLNPNLIQEPIPTEIVQPVVPELELDPFENNPDYIKCRKCKEYKHRNEYYKNPKYKSNFLDCKPCTLKTYRESDRIKREQVLQEQGGALAIRTNPNEYFDDYQKESTFKLMKLMGWSFNEENGIWFKEGIKTKEGIFINLKEGKLRRRGEVYTNKKELLPRIIEMREDKKMSYDSIAIKLGVGHNTIYNWYKEYEKDKKTTN